MPQSLFSRQDAKNAKFRRTEDRGRLSEPSSPKETQRDPAQPAAEPRGCSRRDAKTQRSEPVGWGWPHRSPENREPSDSHRSDKCERSAAISRFPQISSFTLHPSPFQLGHFSSDTDSHGRTQPGLRPEPRRVEKKMVERNMGRAEEGLLLFRIHFRFCHLPFCHPRFNRSSSAADHVIARSAATRQSQLGTAFLPRRALRPRRGTGTPRVM